MVNLEEVATFIQSDFFVQCGRKDPWTWTWMGKGKKMSVKQMSFIAYREIYKIMFRSIER
jgi:hypothetical protein